MTPKVACMPKMHSPTYLYTCAESLHGLEFGNLTRAVEGMKKGQTDRRTDRQTDTEKLGLGGLSPGMEKLQQHPGSSMCYNIELSRKAGLLHITEWQGL